MSEKYSQKQKKTIQNLLINVFTKAREKRLAMRGLAKLLDAQPSTILRWKRMENCPDGYHVWKIKMFLGIPQ